MGYRTSIWYTEAPEDGSDDRGERESERICSSSSSRPPQWVAHWPGPWRRRRCRRSPWRDGRPPGGGSPQSCTPRTSGRLRPGNPAPCRSRPGRFRVRVGPRSSSAASSPDNVSGAPAGGRRSPRRSPRGGRMRGTGAAGAPAPARELAFQTRPRSRDDGPCPDRLRLVGPQLTGPLHERC